MRLRKITVLVHKGKNRCSNVNRAKRRKTQGVAPAPIEIITEVTASGAKRVWARLIKQVYGVDLLVSL